MVTNAWLFECSDSLSIAVAEHEMAEYLQASVSFSIPGAPVYCANVLLWQNNFIPILDIAVLLGEQSDSKNKLLCVVVFQSAEGQPLQRVAICVNKPPEKILVNDEQACEFPEAVDESVLLPVSLSCFEHIERPVIILDIAKLCSADFRDLVNAI